MQNKINTLFNMHASHPARPFDMLDNVRNITAHLSLFDILTESYVHSIHNNYTFFIPKLHEREST